MSLLMFNVSFSPNRCLSALSFTFFSTCITSNVYFCQQLLHPNKKWKLITIVIGAWIVSMRWTIMHKQIKETLNSPHFL
jgi:hypothetical protein